MTSLDLFETPSSMAGKEEFAPGAWLLRGFALDRQDSLQAHIDSIRGAAPFRHLITPGGFRMSVAMTNCGRLGWVSDTRGYRYDACDPLNGRPWPPMPAEFLELARAAALAAGYPGFAPDACLINRYEPGARLTLHQDKDERNFAAPIVSVSLGLPATFLFGGNSRRDKPRRIALMHGDVAVWGGLSRLHHHGVAALEEGHHRALGAQRINLTFRCAG
ncbi:MAG TPA: DNA oxidative demethylase AlkB [Steroidobacteraceae bacterium]|nr:DNA oxidative demethylase AlkB [Steroidobacteraceae bacterium]